MIGVRFIAKSPKLFDKADSGLHVLHRRDSRVTAIGVSRKRFSCDAAAAAADCDTEAAAFRV